MHSVLAYEKRGEKPGKKTLWRMLSDSGNASFGFSAFAFLNPPSQEASTTGGGPLACCWLRRGVGRFRVCFLLQAPPTPFAVLSVDSGPSLSLP